MATSLPPHDTILVRYGEIGIKSRSVRNRMEKSLVHDLEEGLVRRGAEGVVRRLAGRIFIEPGADGMELAGDVAAHTFGITTYSPVVRVSSDFDALLEAMAAYAERHWSDDSTSFAVRARRAGTHPYSSQDVAVKGGSSVYEAMHAKGVPVRVDLSEPDWALHVEVRDRDAYLFHERFSGPGGLPLGSQGKMVVVLDRADAAAAAYLMMRRGAQVHALYLPQIVGGLARDDVPEKVDEDDHPARHLHERLKAWNAPRFLRPWWIDDITIEGVTGDPLPEDGVPLARVMLDAAELYARMVKADAIVTGETSAVPWAIRLPESQDGVQLPVLRPLMGLSRPLIDDFREELGLERSGGERKEGEARAFTAGGRREGRRRVTVPEEGGSAEGPAWDPW